MLRVLIIISALAFAPSAFAINMQEAKNEHMKYCFSRGGAKEICLCSFEKNVEVLGLQAVYDLNKKLLSGIPPDEKKLKAFTKHTKKCAKEINQARKKAARSQLEPSAPTSPIAIPDAPSTTPPATDDDKLPERDSKYLSELKSIETVKPEINKTEPPKIEKVKKKPKKKRKTIRPPKYLGEYNDLFFKSTRSGDLQGLNAITQVMKDVDIRDNEGNTPLIVAAQYGQETSARFLLSKKADPNAVNLGGQTALHIASFAGQTNIIKELLAKKADINKAYGIGYTPLILAVMRQDAATAQLLIGKGAKIDHSMEDGNSALHVASSKNSTALIKILVQNGADVNTRNSAGYTPLMVAAMSGTPYAAYELLQNGADYTATDAAGRTATTLAHATGNKNVVNAILTFREQQRAY